MSNVEELLCYNKGCGKSFDPKLNTPDSCTYHPGVPVFHDAYKGWSCCKKKCTDFTEFLNIKGCTTAQHNNVKPPEPERPVVDKSNATEVIEYKAPKPLFETVVNRLPFDSPLCLSSVDESSSVPADGFDFKEESGTEDFLFGGWLWDEFRYMFQTTLTATVSDVLRQQVAACSLNTDEVSKGYDGEGEIPAGTTCKNNGCKQTYERAHSMRTPCMYHPGYPVFHEGMKFWTCCTKRTSDFNSFLEQVGCTTDQHVWFKTKSGSAVKCRLDWHQTGSAVYVSIFAKKYDPDRSSVQISPVRLKVCLVFMEQSATYDLDIELRGVIKVEESSVQMLPTKVEIKLRKSNGATWSNLDIPRAKQTAESGNIESDKEVDLTPLEDQVDAVDLSDL